MKRSILLFALGAGAPALAIGITAPNASADTTAATHPKPGIAVSVNGSTAIVEGRENTANVGTGNNNKATVKGDFTHVLAGYGSNNTVDVTGDKNSARAGGKLVGNPTYVQPSSDNSVTINGDAYFAVADGGGETIVLPPPPGHPTPKSAGGSGSNPSAWSHCWTWPTENSERS